MVTDLSGGKFPRIPVTGIVRPAYDPWQRATNDPEAIAEMLRPVPVVPAGKEADSGAGPDQQGDAGDSA